jgi:hypothetical protein
MRLVSLEMQGTFDHHNKYTVLTKCLYNEFTCSLIYAKRVRYVPLYMSVLERGCFHS